MIGHPPRLLRRNRELRHMRRRVCPRRVIELAQELSGRRSLPVFVCDFADPLEAQAVVTMVTLSPE